jgi:class 3 adenylate cyclase
LSVAGESTLALSSFIPAYRAHAMASGGTLAERERGMVLFADVCGFTPLAESLEEALGPQHGAAEVAAWVNRTFGALAEAVDRHHGSIVGSAGDSFTCWFDDEHRLGAVACALEMQAAVAGDVTPGIDGGPAALKVSLAGGEARRLVVGDPMTQVFDVLAGAVVDRAGAGEKLCGPGEVVLDRASADALGDAISLGDARGGFVAVAGREHLVIVPQEAADRSATGHPVTGDHENESLPRHDRVPFRSGFRKSIVKRQPVGS